MVVSGEKIFSLFPLALLGSGCDDNYVGCSGLLERRDADSSITNEGSIFDVEHFTFASGFVYIDLCIRHQT